MKKILLIEPDRVLLEVYKEVFTREGYKVKSVESSSEAILAIEDNKPDLIIIELQLPAHNGIELLNELKSYDDLHECKVIINSIIPADSLGMSSAIKKAYNIVATVYKPDTSIEKLIGLASAALE